ncbi:lactate/malate family dehydrogenase [Hutsoniella sourekii]|uniref:lactate/malate family dehydrogenase n=1 Tax=Hutsoniella sourekii TaxID=87650 RepID=UPI000480A86D|nr:hypothetical protein [Hutsoniella sourekii]
MKHTQKLGIIGMGHVGELVLAYARDSHLFGEIVCLDTRGDKAYGEALDQLHANGLNSRANIQIYAGNYKDLADSDIIIITATHYYEEGQTPGDRQALLANNAAIIRQVMSDISQVTKEAILIFITNPADTVAFMATDEFDYPNHKIMGTGCMLDSSRLRQIIGQHYNVDPKCVSGYMMGEHGYTAVPILSRVSLAGIPYQELDQYFPEIETLSPDEVQKRVVTAAYDVFNNKSGVTNAAIAQAAIELCQAILLDEQAIYNVSTSFYEGEFQTQQATAFAAPTIIGRNGWIKRLEVSLNDWETQKLKESIASIDANIQLAKDLLDS